MEKEFERVYSFNQREFLYFTMINENDSQKIAEWVDNNVYHQRLQKPDMSVSNFGFEVISETENINGQFCFRVETGTLQLQPAICMTAPQFIQHKFGTDVLGHQQDEPDTPQSKLFFKSHTLLLGISSLKEGKEKSHRPVGSVVSKLREMVSQQFGTMAIHKFRILRKISSFFVIPSIRYMFETLVTTERYKLMTIEELKAHTVLSKKFYLPKLEDLCSEITKYFNHKIDLGDSPLTATNMNQLVHFSRRAMSIKMTEYLLEMNDKIVDYWSEYLAFTPWSIVDSTQIEMSSIERERKANQTQRANLNDSLEGMGLITTINEMDEYTNQTLTNTVFADPSAENLTVLKEYSLCFDRVSLLRVTQILRKKLVHLHLEDSIKHAEVQHSKHMISNEYEREKLMLKTAVKGFLQSGLKARRPAVFDKQPLVSVELCESVNVKSKYVGDSREDRILERKQARSFFYAQDQSVISGIFEARLGTLMDATYRKSKSSLGNSKAFKSGEIKSGSLGIIGAEAESFANSRLFEWIAIEKFLLRPDANFKPLFSLFVKLMFEHLTSWEQIDLSMLSQFDVGVKDPFSAQSTENHQKPKPGETFKFPVELPETALEDLFGLAKGVFKHSLLGMVAYLFVLDMFSYLFTQRETLTADLFGVSIKTEEEVFELEESLHSEMVCLQKDHEFITLQMPETIQIGIFTLNLAKFKQDCLKEIRDNLKNIRKTCQNELKKMAESLEKNIDEINETCSKVPENVDSYIRLKKKLISREFESRIVKSKAQSQGLEVLLRSLDFPGGEQPDPRDLKSLVRHLQLKASLGSALDNHNSFLTEFKGAKFNFFSDIGLHKTETLAEFEGL